MIPKAGSAAHRRLEESPAVLLTALFDLDADPNESTNLLLAPTAEVTRVVGQIKAKLAALSQQA